MFIDLDRVPLEGQVLDRTIPVESISTTGEEFRLVSNVDLRGRIQPVPSESSESRRPKPGKGAKGAKPGDDRIYRLRGTMACRIELACVRCLEPVEMNVEEDLDLLYLPQSQNVAPELAESRSSESPDDDEPLPDRGLDPEELAVSFYRDGRIDVSQMIVEQIVLALPMKLLCREDCRGLCPECGVNRNQTSCECEPDDTDPRWAKLKTLLGP
ncbi:MAG: YceD family protein [Vicinamibacteria bacterium]